MSGAQSMLLLVAFLLRHSLTDSALTDLLEMLNLFLPSAFPPSKYKFYKAIQVEDAEVKQADQFKYESNTRII